MRGRVFGEWLVRECVCGRDMGIEDWGCVGGTGIFLKKDNGGVRDI